MSDYRYTDGQSIKQVLQEMLRYYRCDDHIYESRINTAWKKIMGTLISKHTRSLKVRQGVLTIWLDSSVLREELSFGKEKIMTMINKELNTNAITQVLLK